MAKRQRKRKRKLSAPAPDGQERTRSSEPSRVEPRETRGWAERPWLYAVGLILVCVIVWHGTYAVPFHFDDEHTIQKNVEIRNLGNWKTFLKHFYSRGLLKLGFAFNYALAQKKPDLEPYPESFHLVNMALHAINVALVFWLIWLVAPKLGVGDRRRAAVAGLIALLFAVSPIHTMTVNLAANRAVLQSAAFTLAGLILGLYALTEKRGDWYRWIWWAAAGIALLCSVSSKSTGIVTLGLFLLLAYYVTRPSPRLMSLMALGATGIGLGAFLLLSRAGQVWQSQYHGVGANLVTQSGVVLSYVGLMLWPQGLNVDHDVAAVKSLWQARGFFPTVAVTALLAGGGFLAYRRHVLGLCVLWFFVALAPTSSIIPRVEIMMEYRAYLAALGFYGAAVWAFSMLAARINRRWSGIRPATVVLGLCAAATLAYSAVTITRTRVYHDPISLWRDTVAKSPNKPRPHYNLGTILKERGQRAKAERRLDEAGKDFDEAIKHLERTKELLPSFALAHNNLGLVYKELGNYEQAIIHLKDAIRVDKNGVEARINLAALLKMQGNLAEAEEHLKYAINIKPRSAEAHCNLGLIRIDQGRHEEAEAELKKALHFKPAFAVAHNNLGVVLKARKKYDEAAKHLEDALRLNPRYVNAHFNLGLVRQAQGKHDAAIKHLKDALKFNPEFVAAHNSLGVTLKIQGEYKAAIERFDAAVKFDKNFAPAYNEKGLCLIMLGRHEEAEEALKHALKINPNFAQAHHTLGTALVKLRRYEPAVKHLRKAVEIIPNYTSARVNLGEVLLATNRAKEAGKHFGLALEAAPEDSKTRYSLARALLVQGRHEKAVEHLRQIPPDHKHFAKAQYSIGAVLVKQGHFKEATEHLRRALEIDSKYVEAHNILGVALSELGQNELALQSFRKALEINPKSAESHYNLGLTLEKAGKADEAIRHYERALDIRPDYPAAKRSLEKLSKQK